MTRYVLASSVGLLGLLAAGSALAQTPWQRTERVGDRYTTALNRLYSQGFHRVHGMWMQDGTVHAMTLNRQGQTTPANVDPGTGQISLG
jgi:hypothetical protein